MVGLKIIIRQKEMFVSNVIQEITRNKVGIKEKIQETMKGLKIPNSVSFCFNNEGFIIKLKIKAEDLGIWFGDLYVEINGIKKHIDATTEKENFIKIYETLPIPKKKNHHIMKDFINSLKNSDELFYKFSTTNRKEVIVQEIRVNKGGFSDQHIYTRIIGNGVLNMEWGFITAREKEVYDFMEYISNENISNLIIRENENDGIITENFIKVLGFLYYVSPITMGKLPLPDSNESLEKNNFLYEMGMAYLNRGSFISSYAKSGQIDLMGFKIFDINEYIITNELALTIRNYVYLPLKNSKCFVMFHTNDLSKLTDHNIKMYYEIGIRHHIKEHEKIREKNNYKYKNEVLSTSKKFVDILKNEYESNNGFRDFVLVTNN